MWAGGGDGRGRKRGGGRRGEGRGGGRGRFDVKCLWQKHDSQMDTNK